MTKDEIRKAAHKIVGEWIDQCNVSEWIDLLAPHRPSPSDEELITDAVEAIGKEHAAAAA